MLRVDDCYNSEISAHGPWCWRKWTGQKNKKFFCTKNLNHMSGSRTYFLQETLKVFMPLIKFTALHASVLEKKQEVTWGNHTCSCCRSQGCCQLHILSGDRAGSCTGPGRLKWDQTQSIWCFKRAKYSSFKRYVRERSYFFQNYKAAQTYYGSWDLYTVYSNEYLFCWKFKLYYARFTNYKDIFLVHYGILVLKLILCNWYSCLTRPSKRSVLALRSEADTELQTHILKL